MTRIAINGLGRIGRAVLRIVLDAPELEAVAVNDLAPGRELAYLLRYDTAYGRYSRHVESEDGRLRVGDQELRLTAERDPARLPWRELGVDLVFECTGAFRRREDLQKHLDAGAGAVLLSAPVKGEGVETIVYGVNAPGAESRAISCASCTTNCITPVAEIVGRRIGVRKAVMTTVHAYTATQRLVDGPSQRLRTGRAGAANIVPASTGAAVATTKALPDYVGRFDGIALRVPVLVGSAADLTFVTTRTTTVDELNGVLRDEAASSRYQDVLGVSEDPLVSSDIVGDPRAAVVDLALTMVVDGDLVKIVAWYDNEWGYANQMVREARDLAKRRGGRAT